MKKLLLAAALMLFATPAYAQAVSKGSVQRLVFDNLNSADFTATDDISVGDDLTVTDDATITGDVNISGELDPNGTVDVSGITFGSTATQNPLVQVKNVTVAANDLDLDLVLFSSAAGQNLYIHDIRAVATATPTGPGTDTLVFEESESNNDVIIMNIGALTSGTVVGAFTSGVTFGSAALTGLTATEGLTLRRTGSAAAGLGSYTFQLLYTWQ